MSRSLDIMQAVKYPFRGDNWLNTLVIPGIYLLGLLVVTYITQFVIMIVVGIIIGILGALLAEAGAVLGVLTAFVTAILFMIVIMALQAPLLGYYWEFIGNLRAHGYEATAPDWSAFGRYLIDGLKVMAYQLAVVFILGIIPVFFQVLIMAAFGNTEVGAIFSMLVSVLFWLAAFLLIPFLYAPAIRTSQSKSLNDMFDVGPAIEYGSRCYVKMMLAILIGLGFAIVSIPVLAIASCTIIGGPVVMIALTFIVLHLITQAYDDCREEGDAPAEADAQTT